MSSERVGEHGPAVFAGQSNIDTTKKPTWYNENVKSVSDEGRKLLQEYSKIPSSEVLQHVTQLRDRAFSIWPYACIGQVRFLSYGLSKRPYYEAVLAKLHGGAKFLDVGCCFGQELRFLFHYDQVPARQLYAFDLEPAFVNFGHELFRDKDRFAATMLSGNLMADHGTEDATELDTLEGQIDVIHVASVLHIWAWDDMIRAAKRLVAFSKPTAGSMIIGNQLGSLNAGEYAMPTSKGSNYRHNDESMQRFWKQVGEETGTEWKVSSGMYTTEAITDNKNASWADPNMRLIWFMVERI